MYIKPRVAKFSIIESYIMELGIKTLKIKKLALLGSMVSTLLGNTVLILLFGLLSLIKYADLHFANLSKK